ncbi:DUF2306 domain-containing protein [Rhizobium sp. L1K21]|uniref:DUF2306 domain-containing protein n=1 Tax=Rhizobium sp. L1K21 TaxID=2954933 RepID=UPI002093500D|nr:DUF2306 domain-containing protein [Rhizobium sp. L1K21]MCO6185508.1 DUF2306 domain-containing protein [Rhizobium sp. L1K21]
MSFDPLLSAPLAIQLHVFTVVPAAFLGAYIFTHRKGTPLHRLLGKIWIALMVVGALSSFFIHTIRVWGDFSPIHILSVFVLLASVKAVYSARKGNIKAHRGVVTSMYLGGIVGAGLFTFLPGRLMNAVFLGGYDFSTVPSAAALAPAVLIVALFIFGGQAAWRAR